MESLRSKRFPIRPRGTSADKETEHKRTSSLPAQTSSSTTPSNRVGRFSPSVPTLNHYSELVNIYFPKDSQVGFPNSGFASSRYLPKKESLSSQSKLPRRRSVGPVASEGLIGDLKNLHAEESSEAPVNFKAAQNDAEYAEFSAQALKSGVQFNSLADQEVVSSVDDYKEQALSTHVTTDPPANREIAQSVDPPILNRKEPSPEDQLDAVPIDNPYDAHRFLNKIFGINQPEGLGRLKEPETLRSLELEDVNDSQGFSSGVSNPPAVSFIAEYYRPVNATKSEINRLDQIARTLESSEQDHSSDRAQKPQKTTSLHPDLAFASEKIQKLKEKAMRNHPKEYAFASSSRFPIAQDSFFELVNRKPSPFEEYSDEQDVFMDTYRIMRDLRIKEEETQKQLAESRLQEEDKLSEIGKMKDERDIEFRVAAERLLRLEKELGDYSNKPLMTPQEVKQLQEITELAEEVEMKRQRVMNLTNQEKELKKGLQTLRQEHDMSWHQIRQLRLEEEVNLKKADLLSRERERMKKDEADLLQRNTDNERTRLAASSTTAASKAAQKLKDEVDIPTQYEDQYEDPVTRANRRIWVNHILEKGKKMLEEKKAAIQREETTLNDIPTPKISKQEEERTRTRITREMLPDKPVHTLTREDVNKISENRKIEWSKQLDQKLMRDIFMKEIAQRDDLTNTERKEIYSKASFQESKTAFYEIMNRKIKEAAERSSPPTVATVASNEDGDENDETSDEPSDSEAVGRNGELDLAEVMRQSSKRFVQDNFKETPQTTLKKEEKKYRNMTDTELNEIMVTGNIVESKLAHIELSNRRRAAEQRAIDTKKKEAAAEREAEDPSTPWVFRSPTPPPTTIPPDHLPPYFKPREYVLYDPKESASTPALLSTETEGTSSSLISTHHETVIAQDTPVRHETEPYYGYRENASAPALASDTDSLARYAMQEHMDVSEFKKVENLLASATTSCRPSYNAESEATASVVLPTESESEGVGSTSIAAVGIENEVVVTAVSTGVVAHENEVMPPQLAEETNNTAEESASPPPPPPPAEEVKEEEEEDYEPMDDSLAKFYKDRAVLSLADGHLQEADEIITRLERRANVPAGVDGWGASIYRKTIQVLISSNKLDMAEKLIDHFMVLYSSSSSNSTAGLVKKTPLVSRVGSSKSSFSTKSREAIIPWTTSEAYVKYYKKVSRLKLLNALASKPRDLAMAEKHVNKLLSLLEKMNTGGGWKSSDLVERTHLLAVRGCLKYLKDLPQPAVEELAIVTADGKGLVADRLKVKTWDYLARAYFEASQINSAAKFCQRAVTAYRNADPNSKSSMEALKLMIKIKEAKGDNLEADGYRSMLRPDENTEEFLVDEARNLNNNARTNAPVTAKTKAVLQKLVLGPEWTKTKQVLATYRFPTSLLENYHKLDDLSQMMIVAKRFKGGIQTSLQLLDSAQGVVADSIRLNMNDLLRAMLEISKYNSALSASGYGHPLINFTFMDTWRPPGSKRSFVGRFRPKTLKVTPLSLATDKDNLAAIRILIAHGANVNLKSSHGNTALHLAVKHGRVDVIKILLEAGADVSMMNERGKSALDVARHAEVLRLLKPRMYLLGKQDMGTKSVFDFVADCL